MAKDYFQDIVPSGGGNAIPSRKLRSIAPAPPEPESEDDAPEDEYTDDDLSAGDMAPESAPQRGIRNVNIAARSRSSRQAMQNAGSQNMRGMGGDMREVPPIGRGLPMRPRRGSSRLWVWAIVIVCILVVGFLALFLFRQTSITLTPRVQSVSFDQSSPMTAYPATSAATGTLPYTVATTDLSDSETVTGNGTTATQMKASGNVTVYNNYSASSIKLIGNTRFQTSSGLVFRTPAAIVIPGKVGSTPGSVQVTIVADQAGPLYDIGPSRFVVPGLKSIPAEFTGVYAQSTASMSGGFSGTQEGVSSSVRQGAISYIRARLKQDITQYVQSQNTPDNTAFASLAEITYTDMPDTDASSSTQVQINESAHVEVPLFPAGIFSEMAAQNAGVDTGNAAVTIVGSTGYDAQSDDSTPVVLGTDTIDFSVVGSGNVLWSIDTAALTKALAGRDQSAFQTIIGSFPGIEAARARIEPFWVNTFPSDPTKIKVIIVAPTTTSAAQSQSQSQPAAQQATQ